MYNVREIGGDSIAFYSVAIDGPSSAGKSTIAKAVAAELGFTYLDTGAMYRALTLKLHRNGIDPSDTSALLQIFEATTISQSDDSTKIYLDGQDVSQDIRQHEISELTSQYSALPQIREWLVEMQRKIGEGKNIVMDGRDIGTHVLPNATVKIFLTATLQDRANRRYMELTEKGVQCTLEQIERDMEVRDIRDSTRDVTPLAKAEDAILVDTTGFPLEKSIAHITAIVKERLR